MKRTPSTAGTRSKNSRDDSPKKLRDEPRMKFAVLPQVAAGYASYALLRFEINVREASVMGFVGAGGIGQELVVAIRKFYYSDVSAILVTIIVICSSLSVLMTRFSTFSTGVSKRS